jgi:hypothetical protein
MLRPGDTVRIHCQRFMSLSGDEAHLLLYSLDGPAGSRWAIAASNELLLAAMLLTALLPSLVAVLIVIESDSRPRRAPG